MKKILIVGGVGYIGGFMTDLFLSKKEYEVTVYDNLLYETRYMKKVHFINGDIRDTKLLGSIVNDYDMVAWLAAIVGDGACASDTQLAAAINVDTVKWLVNHYDGKIIFTSTCSVYGINDNLLDENSDTNPLSAYATTKLAAERYIVEHARNYLIFRLGTLYGIGDEHSRMRLDLVANILTLKAVNGEALSVFGGEQWRPLLHVRDVAYACEYCIDQNISGLYILSEMNMKIAELADTIKEIVPHTNISYLEMKFEDLRNYKVDNSKILATGWKPKYHFQDGIKDMYCLFKEDRIKNTQDAVYYNVNFINYLKLGGKHGFGL